jgi:hypothetical protein
MITKKNKPVKLVSSKHPLDSIASAKKGSANNKKVMYPKKNC